MALPNITSADFTGWVKITANSFKGETLTQYISLFRTEYLRNIVGARAFQAIESTVRQKWSDLINGTYYTDRNGKTQYHNGLRTSLVYFIYFQFERDNFRPVQAGKVKTAAENSERNSVAQVLEVARERYNAGVRLINATTCAFLEANSEYIETVTVSTDNTDNTYTLSISSTKYLENDDEITIDGTSYVVSNVVANTSVDINAGTTGLDFNGRAVTWRPFEFVEFSDLEPSGL